MENFDIEVLSKAITDGQVHDSVDIENIDITELFDSDILDSIAGLREIKSLYKGYISIRDRLFTKKFVLFLKEFKSKTITEKKLNEFIINFNSNKKFRTRIMENLVAYIDEYKQMEKVKILSRLFKAYIEGHFDWTHLANMAECLDKVNLDFLKNIPMYDTSDGKEVTEFDEDIILEESNLVSAGLVVNVSSWSSDAYPTKLGKDIFKYGVS